MKTHLARLALTVTFALTLPLSVCAQVTYTLDRALPAPAPPLQKSAFLGTSVAVEGALTAAGIAADDTGEIDAGVVKVFNSSTGALLHLIPNPSPRESDRFGDYLAISGSRLVVGAPLADVNGTDNGKVYIYDLSSAAPAVPIATLNNPVTGSTSRFGGAVGISGNLVVVGASGGVGSAYAYDLTSATPAVPIHTLNNPTPATDDNFGRSVAISGSRVVVGTPSDDTLGTNVGIAYVYDLSGANPTLPVRTLNNPNPHVNDAFGIAAVISGTRVVVAAPFEDTGATSSGTAYAFDLSGANPGVPTATLSNPSPALLDRFGLNMALSGARLAIGVASTASAIPSSGKVYIYDLASATPSIPSLTLQNPTPAQDDGFAPVAIAGTRVVVGAPGDDTRSVDSGSAYAFELGSGTPTIAVATYNDPGFAGGDLFGWSVAVSGTLVVVGASAEDTGATNAGSAYVYDSSSATPLVPIAVLHNPEPAAEDYFGSSVAIAGTRIVVGAPADGSRPGKAFVFNLNSPTPTVPFVALNSPGPLGSTRYGFSVAISGARVVIGSFGDDTGALGAGRVYAYDLGSPQPAVATAMLDNPNPAQFDQFGISVAISGARVVVGANRADIGAPDTGRVYVFDLDSAVPATPIATLNNPAPTIDDSFGASVAIQGTRIVVGAPGESAGAILFAGSAYVYDLANSTPTVPLATLLNPSPTESDTFGASVAVSGTRVVVGAELEDSGATNAGVAYVYDLSGPSGAQPVAVIANPVPASGDNFAYGIGIDGPVVAIGTPFANSPMADEGRVHVFTSDADHDGLLDGWELAHFGTTSARSALEDGDADGRAELLEEAFGTDPLVSNPAAGPVIGNEGGFLTLTLAKYPGVTYTVQSAGAPDSLSFSAATTMILSNSATILKVRDSFPIANAVRRFIRVQVTSAP